MKKMILIMVAAVAVQQLAKYLGISNLSELQELVTTKLSALY